MRILYAYFKACGTHRDFEANFSIRDGFHFDYDSGVLTLPEKLPEADNRFWTICGGNNVECVSAVIGENGAGKTSLSRRMMDVFSRGLTSVAHLMILQKDGRLIVHAHLPQGKSAAVISAVHRRFPAAIEWHGALWDSALNKACYVYLSPYFSHGCHYLRESRQRQNVFDLSTTALVKEAFTESQKGNLTNPIGKYYSDELKRILRVVHQYATRKDVRSVQSSVLMGSRLFVSPMRSAIRKLEEWTFQQRDSPIADLRRAAIRASKGCAPKPPQKADVGLYSFADAFAAYIIDFVAHEDNPGPDVLNGLSALAQIAMKIAAKEIVTSAVLATRLEELTFQNPKLGTCVKALAHIIRLASKFRNRMKHKSLRLPLMERDEAFFNEVLEFIGKYVEAVSETDFLDFEIEHQPSSGEMSFLSIWGRLYDLVTDGKRLRNASHLVVFLDELEVTLHPIWQRQLVRDMIWFFETFAPTLKVHLIFASHSPILLSDIPKSHVVFLAKKSGSISFQGMLNDTFGANIFELYSESFALEQGPVGAFAAGKIEGILKKLAAEVESGLPNPVEKVFNLEERETIASIGDPIVRRYVMSYVRKMGGGGFAEVKDGREALKLS